MQNLLKRALLALGLLACATVAVAQPAAYPNVPGPGGSNVAPPPVAAVGLDYALFSRTGFTGGPVGDAVVLVTSDAVLASAEFG